MSKAGPGLSPNKQAASGHVKADTGSKIFKGHGGPQSAAPKAPSLKPGQTPKTTGK